MAYTIAVAGKGGVGKTTVCGMMIDALIKGGKGPLLAVYHALPRPGENRALCGGCVAALRTPCVPCRFQVLHNT